MHQWCSITQWNTSDLWQNIIIHPRFWIEPDQMHKIRKAQPLAECHSNANCRPRNDSNSSQSSPKWEKKSSITHVTYFNHSLISTRIDPILTQTEIKYFFLFPHSTRWLLIHQLDFFLFLDLSYGPSNLFIMVFEKFVSIGGVVFSEAHQKPMAVVNVISLTR